MRSSKLLQSTWMNGSIHRYVSTCGSIFHWMKSKSAVLCKSSKRSRKEQNRKQRACSSSFGRRWSATCLFSEFQFLNALNRRNELDKVNLKMMSNKSTYKKKIKILNRLDVSNARKKFVVILFFRLSVQMWSVIYTK